MMTGKDAWESQSGSGDVECNESCLGASLTPSGCYQLVISKVLRTSCSLSLGAQEERHFKSEPSHA